MNKEGVWELILDSLTNWVIIVIGKIIEIRFMSNFPPLNFTEAAATKVYQLIQEENNPALKLRVFITGGGCSGFQYGFTFDEKN